MNNALGAMLMAGFAAPVAAETMDRIVAVVDNFIILQSDLEELDAVFGTQAPLNEMSEEERWDRLLERLIDEKVQLVVAQRDTTIVLEEDDLESRVRTHIANLIEENGGEEQFAKLLEQSGGMDLESFRIRIREQMREQILKQQLQEKYVGRVEPSRNQVRHFYREYADSLPVLQDNYRISHLEMKVVANSEIDRRAYRLCDSLRGLLDKGVTFEYLAKTFSDDPSGEAGGDLGFTRRGTLDQDYERAAHRLGVGEVSPGPVRSQFGYHLIKVTGKRDTQIRTSHVLIRVVPTAEDTLRTVRNLDSLRSAVSSGELTFAEAVRRHSSDNKTRDFGGDLGWFTKETLSETYREIVDTLEVGGITGPEFMGNAYHLFRLDARDQERRLTLENDWDRIAQLAKSHLFSRKLKEYVDRWRKEVHIENRLAGRDDGGKQG